MNTSSAAFSCFGVPMDANSSSIDWRDGMWRSAVWGWLLLLAVCSLLPIYSLQTSPFLQAFDIRKALSALFHNNASREHQRLAFLDVFRFWAICWVISNHLSNEGRLDVLEGGGDQFKRDMHLHPVLGPLFGNSALGVEIFLLLSGLLVARSWARRWRQDRPFLRNTFTFLLHRWLRLAPAALAFMLLAIAPWTQRTFPLFHRSMAAKCDASQLAAHTALFGNWTAGTCFGYLWYLGLDWQCHLLAPFLIHLLIRRRRLGIALIGVLIAGSVLLRAAQCRANGICDKSDVDIPFVAPSNSANSSVTQQQRTALYQLYTRPATKMGPFLIGLLLGVLTLREKSELPLQSESARKGALSAGFGASMAIVYAILPQYWSPDQGDTVYNTVYTAAFRTAFAGAIALVFAACFCRREERAPLSPLWAVLARLTFSVYLVHMPVVFLFTQVDAFQHVNSAYGLLLALSPAVLISFIAALAFHCLVESPISRIIFAFVVKL